MAVLGDEKNKLCLDYRVFDWLSFGDLSFGISLLYVKLECLKILDHTQEPPFPELQIDQKLKIL